MTNRDVRNQLHSIASANDFATSSVELTEAWRATGVGVEVIDTVLQFMEEYPALDYGVPGPLVHFVEEYSCKGYEERLVKSVNKKPTMLTVWMLNRLINGTQDPRKRHFLISTMSKAIQNPDIDHQTLERVNGFLEHLKSEL